MDAEKKDAVAKTITKAHADVTGAPPVFAQVIFQDLAAGDASVGGAPLSHEYVFIHGHIRGGRSTDGRNALLNRIIADVAQAAGVQTSSVWIYLLEPPAAAMAEFAHILPAPRG